MLYTSLCGRKYMLEIQNEIKYRSAINRIAGTMLIFLLLTNTLGIIAQMLNEIWKLIPNEVISTVASSLTDGIVYILGFMLPVVFFRLLSKGQKIEPMKLAPCLPKETFAYIMAGMAVILVMSYLNYYMISFTDYAAFAEEMLWVESYDSPHAIVMSFLTMAIIPAFVEEFLFRGLIQSNLRPYGRGVAIIGSAVIFGAMHQNIQQIFYATIAGLVLGYLYEVTDSIWCSILLHFLNNSVSVFNTVISHRFDAPVADRIQVLIDGAIFGIGAICLIGLICRHTRKPDFTNGYFAQSMPDAPDYVACEVEVNRKIRLFFSPMMIAYLVLCFSTMVTYFAIALLTYGK